MDIFKRIEESLVNDIVGINGNYYNKKFLLEVLKELKLSVKMAEMEIDTLSKRDIFAMNILMDLADIDPKELRKQLQETQ